MRNKGMVYFLLSLALAWLVIGFGFAPNLDKLRQAPTPWATGAEK